MAEEHSAWYDDSDDDPIGHEDFEDFLEVESHSEESEQEEELQCYDTDSVDEDDIYPLSRSLARSRLRDLFVDDNIPEHERISRLKAVLQANPTIVHEKDHAGVTLLHHAACDRSPEFCQVIVTMNEDLVRTKCDNGWFPVYYSCAAENTNTAKYLFKLYPEGIGIPSTNDLRTTPLHTVICEFAHRRTKRTVTLDLIQFLLQNDQGALSSPDHAGHLPLHKAISHSIFIVSKLVFNAYPNAIHIADNHGDTPLSFARYCDQVEMVDFLEQQMEFERQARADTTPNIDGQLPIHRAIQSKHTTSGTIKLMLAANPASIAAVDNQGNTPLHIACHADNLDAAKYLMGVQSTLDDSLKAPNTRGNHPLHLACLQGNCKIISCILEQSTYGVTLQNSDEQTPIDLLLFESKCDRESTNYVEAIMSLFHANPIDTLKCLVKKENAETINEKQGAGIKRKRVYSFLGSF